MAHSQTRVLQPMVTIGRQQLEDDKTRTTRRERQDENEGEENSYSQGDDDGEAATCWRRPGSKNSSTRFDAEKELISASTSASQVAYAAWNQEGWDRPSCRMSEEEDDDENDDSWDKQ
ncbi:hypothetical protein E4U12_001366, partial [Claviceps purpurea]